MKSKRSAFSLQYLIVSFQVNYPSFIGLSRLILLCSSIYCSISVQTYFQMNKKNYEKRKFFFSKTVAPLHFITSFQSDFQFTVYHIPTPDPPIITYQLWQQENLEVSGPSSTFWLVGSPICVGGTILENTFAPLCIIVMCAVIYAICTPRP